MIKHIVMWRIKDNVNGKSKVENMLTMKKMLEELKSKIDYLVEIEAGIDFNNSTVSYDIVLYSVFNSKEDLDKYQIHPDHVKVKEFIGSIASERVVVDYQI